MSFDWVSFAFQLVNVLILLAILRHFLFRPVAEVIGRRQAQTDAALQAAAAAKAEAEQAQARAQAEAQANASARAELLAQARTEGEARKQALLDAARKEAATILADGKAALEQDRAGAQALALDRARELASLIARRALAAQPAAWSGYVERLASTLGAMAPAEREALLKGADLRLVSPAALTAQDLAVARAALSPFDISPPVEVEGDLIAGLELRSGSGAIRNSLAYDLDRMAEALRDGRPG